MVSPRSTPAIASSNLRRLEDVLHGSGTRRWPPPRRASASRWRENTLGRFVELGAQPLLQGPDLTLERVDSDLAELTVADDGRGLPEGFDWGRTDSLGLQIVHSLARQLHGTISTDGTRGTAVTLRFPTADSGEKA